MADPGPPSALRRLLQRGTSGWTGYWTVQLEDGPHAVSVMLRMGATTQDQDLEPVDTSSFSDSTATSGCECGPVACRPGGRRATGYTAHLQSLSKVTRARFACACRMSRTCWPPACCKPLPARDAALKRPSAPSLSRSGLGANRAVTSRLISVFDRSSHVIPTTKG